MNTGVGVKDLAIEVEGLTCAFGNRTVVRSLDLAIDEGEFLSLLGPSGCGKTTTLRCIAGLEMPVAGIVRINGKDVSATPSEARNLGVVFQHYALFPHLNVFDNVAFGCRHRSIPDIRRRVMETLDLVQMVEFSHKPVYELSGGQQQRIALARALAPRPVGLLLDEPFSNLDSRLRMETREQVRRIVREIGMTTVLVTHDRDEAFALSDRIAVMTDGAIAQVGTPEAIYRSPRTRGVAEFWGDANCLPVKHLRLNDDSAGFGFFRPESVAFETECTKGDDHLCWSGRVETSRFDGPFWRCTVTCEVGVIRIAVPSHNPPPEVGAACRVAVSVDRVFFVS